MDSSSKLNRNRFKFRLIFLFISHFMVNKELRKRPLIKDTYSVLIWDST